MRIADYIHKIFHRKRLATFAEILEAEDQRIAGFLGISVAEQRERRRCNPGFTVTYNPDYRMDQDRIIARLRENAR